MPGPLAGSLNALSAPQYDDLPTGLVIPGGNPGGPYVPRTQQREMGLGEILGKLGGMAGATLDVPRLMAYNLGPALVGRPGQGPQTGAELFGRLGLDPNSPAQRAIGHGGGAALDMLANPINLLTMGSGGATANRVAGPLTSRLEAMAGEGLAGRLAGNPATGSIAGMEQGSLLNPRFSPSMSPFSGRQPYTAAEMIAERAGMAPRPPTPPPITPRTDFAALRSEQLNSPSFNPSLPAPGLGTPSFSQEAPTSNLLNRLQRMATPSTPTPSATPPSVSPTFNPGRMPFDPTYLSTPILSRADQARQLGRQGLPTQPLEGFRGATRLDTLPPAPRPVSSAPDGPGLFPGAPNLTAHDLGVAPEQLISPRAVTLPSNRQGTLPLTPPTPPVRPASQPPVFQDMMPPDELARRLESFGQRLHGMEQQAGIGSSAGVPAVPPSARQEYNQDQFRAFYQAMQNPGRGSTLGPRSPTLPSGQIDY